MCDASCYPQEFAWREENDYFLRSFEALGVSEKTWATAAPDPIIARFGEVMLGAAREGYPLRNNNCPFLAKSDGRPKAGDGRNPLTLLGGRANGISLVK